MRVFLVCCWPGPDDPLVMTHWLATIDVARAIPHQPGQCISFVFLQTWHRWLCASVPPAIGSATYHTVLYVNVHYRCPSKGGKKGVYFAVMSHYCSFRTEVSCWQLQLSVKYMLFLSCQSGELRHNAFTSEWPEGWLSSAFPFLMEMGKSAGKKVFLFYFFCCSTAHLVFLCTQPPVSRHGWNLSDR